MGVYHVMGLGRSPGAVTSVLHYLKDRLAHQPTRDEFFGQSGEWKHRSADTGESARPPGYVQGLVLITTPELHSGVVQARFERAGKLQEGNAIEIVRNELQDLRHGLTCDAAASIEFLVAEVPFRMFDLAFERSLAIMRALHPPGKTGKEVWVNLTAGDNTLNLVLHTVASLTGTVGRLYCINVSGEQERQLTHPVANQCIGTKTDTFWVDLPFIAVQDNELRAATLRILEENGSLDDTMLLDRLKSSQWKIIDQIPDIEGFRRQILHSMAAQRLIERVGEHQVRIGPMWKRLSRYFELVSRRGEETSLRKLAVSNPDWAHWEEL